jgi:hypothetical protein
LLFHPKNSAKTKRTEAQRETVKKPKAQGRPRVCKIIRFRLKISQNTALIIVQSYPNSLVNSLQQFSLSRKVNLAAKSRNETFAEISPATVHRVAIVKFFREETNENPSAFALLRSSIF